MVGRRGGRTEGESSARRFNEVSSTPTTGVHFARTRDAEISRPAQRRELHDSGWMSDTRMVRRDGSPRRLKKRGWPWPVQKEKEGER